MSTYIPFFFACALLVGALVLVYYFLLFRKDNLTEDKRFPRQVVLILLSFIVFWIIIFYSCPSMLARAVSYQQY